CWRHVLAARKCGVEVRNPALLRRDPQPTLLDPTAKDVDGLSHAYHSELHFAGRTHARVQGTVVGQAKANVEVAVAPSELKLRLWNELTLHAPPLDALSQTRSPPAPLALRLHRYRRRPSPSIPRRQCLLAGPPVATRRSRGWGTRTSRPPRTGREPTARRCSAPSGSSPPS